MKGVSVVVLMSAMQMIARGTGDHLASLGVSRADFDLVTRDDPWLPSDRSRVRQTLDAIVFGALDAAGQPRYEVPAEHVAAVISMFPSPVNQMVACRWMESARTAADLSVAPQSGATPLSAEQLHALVLICDAQEARPALIEQWQKRVGYAIRRLQDEEAADAKA